MNEIQTRLLTPPLGWPVKFRAVIVTPSRRHPLFAWNRYPRQVIGFAVRLPDKEELGRRRQHKALSIMWAKPARWWRR